MALFRKPRRSTIPAIFETLPAPIAYLRPVLVDLHEQSEEDDEVLLSGEANLDAFVAALVAHFGKPPSPGTNAEFRAHRNLYKQWADALPTDAPGAMHYLTGVLLSVRDAGEMITSGNPKQRAPAAPMLWPDDTVFPKGWKLSTAGAMNTLKWPSGAISLEILQQDIGELIIRQIRVPHERSRGVVLSPIDSQPIGQVTQDDPFVLGDLVGARYITRLLADNTNTYARWLLSRGDQWLHANAVITREGHSLDLATIENLLRTARIP